METGWLVTMAHGLLSAWPHEHVLYEGEERYARSMADRYAPRLARFAVILRRPDGQVVVRRGRS